MEKELGFPVLAAKRDDTCSHVTASTTSLRSITATSISSHRTKIV
jgi:hypothetical protein